MQSPHRTRNLRYRGSLLLALFIPTLLASAQPEPLRTTEPTGQTIRGRVIDSDTQAPLPGASVFILGVEPFRGTTTDAEGAFVLAEVPLGRQTLQVSYVGYETLVWPNVLVTSGKEVVLTVELREEVIQGAGITVVAEFAKERPLNDMALVSARSFSVEETRRYAGGVDDPARMASAFAGVASTGGVQQNALSIRGNAPKGVLWRLEGVEIPNPNHFAGLSVAGGGGLTLFSSQLLADSDFFTGAFPAEYGNALSGVFDMNFRSGNAATREHTVQVGLIGVDVASEGPFVRGKPSSYLFNYRYSTLALLMPLLPTDAGTSYQDLSFKLSFPTRKAGRFEVWGIGGLDHQNLQANPDSSEWQYELWDRTRFEMNLGVGAAGISHDLLLSDRSALETRIAATINRTQWDQERIGTDLVLHPNLYINSTTSRIIFGSTLNHKFGPRHVNRTGFSVQHLLYDLNLMAAPDDVPPVVPVAAGEGSGTLLQLSTQSRLNLLPVLALNLGIHAQYFELTGHHTLEPRVGLRWNVAPRQALSLGYGLHSQIEELRFYLVQHTTPSGPVYPNRSLDFTKAHHAVIGYDRAIGEASRLKLEGYYQYLFDVPVIPDSSFSMLNLEQDWTFDEPLVNDGLGKNYGLELTAERFLQDGYYWLATGSLFRSSYRGGDGIWRRTRFDQGYAANLLFGKEFSIGSRNNLLGLNGRVIAVGGKRHSPVDLDASRIQETVVYDEYRAFEARYPHTVLLDLTVTYRLNRRRFAETWALQVKNALAAKDVTLDYNYALDTVELVKEGYPLPVLSYKIEF